MTGHFSEEELVVHARRLAHIERMNNRIAHTNTVIARMSDMIADLRAGMQELTLLPIGTNPHIKIPRDSGCNTQVIKHEPTSEAIVRSRLSYERILSLCAVWVINLQDATAWDTLERLSEWYI